MTCEEFVGFLMAYLDDELEEGPRRVFESHMQLCPPCLVYVETYRDSIRAGRLACQDDGPPEDAPEMLIQAILAARKAESG